MPLAERRSRAPRSRARRLALESLETRLVPAIIGPTPFAAAIDILARPAVLGMVDVGSAAGVSNPARVTGQASPYGLTPQQIRTAYGFTGIAFGSISGNGAGQTIAIVDAYNDPYLVGTGTAGFATSDLARFDQAFGLPAPPSFIKLGEYGTGVLPGTDPAGAGNPAGNWETEEALDVEWAHALAPQANLVLVEANSSSSADLYQGVSTAKGLAGVTVVSMSWGSSEYQSELTFDGVFTTPAGHTGVTFVAATGDSGSPGEYPAYSPNVAAAGGTTLTLSSGGGYGSESGWSGSGGGTSAFEPQPAYQEGVQATGQRTTPDVSFNANPTTGVAVCDQYNTSPSDPWEQIGGTSAAAPSWAALFAIVDQGRMASGSTSLDGSTQTLPMLYQLSASAFHDVTTGSNGGYRAGVGYDEVTGLGSPVANVLAADLVGTPQPSPTEQVVIATAPPANVTAGEGFGLTINVETATGALEAGYHGLVTVSLASAPQWSALGGTVSMMATGGVATFSGLFLTEVSSGDVLRVTAGGASAVSTPIVVTPGAPAALVVVGQPPSQVPLGSSFGMMVAVIDPFGNLVTSYNGLVAVAEAAGPVGGVLAGQVIVASTNGVADFTDLALEGPGAGYVIGVGAQGLSPAYTTPIQSVAPPRSVKVHAHFAHPRESRARWWGLRHERVVHAHRPR